MSQAFVTCQMLLFDFDYNDYIELTKKAFAFKCKIWFRWFDRVFSEAGYQVIPVLIASHSHDIIGYFLEIRQYGPLFTRVKPIEPSAEDLLWIEEQNLS